MEATSLATLAGAQGELGGVLMIRAYHLSRGEGHRKTVLVPDSAHGTNPASATMCGFRVQSIPSDSKGNMDLDALKEACNSDVVGLMLTLPNTLGLFDTNILEICQAVHEAGGLVYGDGANMNALLGPGKAGRSGLRRTPPQPTQDLQHAPRRRRPRGWARVRRAAPGLPSCHRRWLSVTSTTTARRGSGWARLSRPSGRRPPFTETSGCW